MPGIDSGFSVVKCMTRPLTNNHHHLEMPKLDSRGSHCHADPVQWCHITGTVWTGKDTSPLVFPCEQSFSSTSSETVKRRQLAACSCRVLAGKKERLPIAAVEVAQVPIEQS